MDTQLVKLDAPYNLICNKEEEFGLHIATLIVTKTFEDGSYRIITYPVVERFGKPGGEVWEDNLLETCKVVCRYNEHIDLQTVKDVMNYYYGWARVPSTGFVWKLKKALASNKTHVYLPLDKNQKDYIYKHITIKEYSTELIFDNDKETEVCTVYSSDESYFFFLESIDYNPNNHAHPGDDEETTIIKIAWLRNTYQMAFAPEGVKKITFYTRNKDYQDYIEKLNNYPDAGE